MNQGTRWALLMQRKRHQKSYAWAPLKEQSCKIPMRIINEKSSSIQFCFNPPSPTPTQNAVGSETLNSNNSANLKLKQKHFWICFRGLSGKENQDYKI
jgi:hypothetical protein